MPRKHTTPPAYRQKMVRGRTVAAVTLSDAATGRRRDYLLGAWGSPESRERYAALLAAWEARGRRLDAAGATKAEIGVGLTVTQVLAAYWDHVQQAGYSPAHLCLIGAVIRSFRAAAGHRRAESVTVRDLRAWRASLAGEKLLTAGRRARMVVAAYRWAMLNELVPASAYTRLAAIEHLRTPRSIPVGPAPAADVAAVLAVAPTRIAAMVRVQLATGMRPGELCAMRAADIDRTAAVWVYRPASHKTAHRGKSRAVYIGPRAQAELAPLLSGRSDDAYIFDPREAVAEARDAREAARKTPRGTGNGRGASRRASPLRAAGARYTAASYRVAVARLCDKAGVPRWHPHQLRHSYATAVERAYGVEAARVLLGHSSALITSAVYVARDDSTARKISAEFG